MQVPCRLRRDLLPWRNLDNNQLRPPSPAPGGLSAFLPFPWTFRNRRVMPGDVVGPASSEQPDHRRAGQDGPPRRRGLEHRHHPQRQQCRADNGYLQAAVKRPGGHVEAEQTQDGRQDQRTCWADHQSGGRRNNGGCYQPPSMDFSHPYTRIGATALTLRRILQGVSVPASSTCRMNLSSATCQPVPSRGS